MTYEDRADNPDRPRGVLSPTDRKWLLGVTEYDNRQQEYDRRVAIRERIENALLDFHLLLTYREKYDLRAITGERALPLRRGLIDTVALVYGLASEYYSRPGSMIQQGVQKGEHTWFDRRSRATLQVNEFSTDVDAVCELLDRGEPESLTDAEHDFIAQVLAESDVFDGDMFRELYHDTDEGERMKRALQAAELEVDSDVITLERHLQTGEVTAADVRNLYEDEAISTKVYMQLTRDELLLEPDTLTDEAYRELLEITPPMLENKTMRDTDDADE